MTLIAKPQPGEYAAYIQSYIDRVPDDGRVLAHLATSLAPARAVIEALPADKLAVPCAPGEWTVKEILLHMIDTERVFAYRALRFARADTTDLPGFDENAYAAYSSAHARSLDSLFAEYAAVRAATLALFATFDEAALCRAGTANAYPLSVRAALYIIAGHELHHLASIQTNYGQG